MAYIGTIKLKNTWDTVQSLVRAQITGQSSFTFDTSKTYLIQNHGHDKVFCANTSAAPSSDEAGECLLEHAFAKYAPDTSTLYVRSGAGNVTELSISELS